MAHTHTAVKTLRLFSDLFIRPRTHTHTPLALAVRDAGDRHSVAPAAAASTQPATPSKTNKKQQRKCESQAHNNKPPNLPTCVRALSG